MTVDDLIESYKHFLIKQDPGLIKKYKKNEKYNADGAKFEAVCYWLLQSRGLKVSIDDAGASGGADFLCLGPNCRFVVEATTINTLAMESKTGMKHDQSNVSDGWYTIFPTLYAKLNDKVRQLHGYDVPSMVALGSFHNESFTLFRSVMADEYLSVFFERDEFRRTRPENSFNDISAFTLVAIRHDRYRAMAFLNPAPRHYFGIQFLPDIWFRQITQRGLKDGTLSGEWVKTNTRGSKSFDYLFEKQRDDSN